MKVLILGHARHGKDTVAEVLSRRFGLKFTSTSLLCAEKIIYFKMKHFYKSVEECYEDRANNRSLWVSLINDYTSPANNKGKEKPARFIKEVFEVNDIYVGIRSYEQLYAAESYDLHDLTIWVDASKRLPLEETCEIKYSREFHYIDNNGEFNEEYICQQFLKFCEQEIKENKQCIDEDDDNSYFEGKIKMLEAFYNQHKGILQSKK